MSKPKLYNQNNSISQERKLDRFLMFSNFNYLFSERVLPIVMETVEGFQNKLIQHVRWILIYFIYKTT